MRIGRLALVAPFVLLVACAEKSRPPEMAPAPPPGVTVQPSPPARPAAPSAEAPPPPIVVIPSPSGPGPSAAPPTEPPSTERAGATAVLFVGVQRANFRQAPDLKARILAVLTKGTRLTVMEKSGQWYRVRLDDGKEGWVAESVTSTRPD
jgi:Bacterial SH3 domain